MKRIIACLAFILAILVLDSCDDGNGATCTLEFRYIGLTVNGSLLSDYYTIRLSNSDTIRLSNGGYVDPTFYPVLDDNYQSEIANSEERFNFIGEIDDSIVVNEIFVIKADFCHIAKVSGKEMITL